MRDSKLKNREALMEASLNEFSETSFDQASLNRIIKNAGVSKGSFYYHFQNKEDLYRHLLKESVEAKWTFIHHYSAENQLDFEAMDIFDKFMFQARAGILFADEYPRFNGLASMFAKEKGTEIYDKVIEDLGGDSDLMLRDMILDAYKKGQLDTGFEIEFIEIMISKLFGKFDEFFGLEENLDDRLKHLETFVRFMKVGLASKV